MARLIESNLTPTGKTTSNVFVASVMETRGKTPLSKTINDTAIQLGFLMWQLGMEYPKTGL